MGSYPLFGVVRRRWHLIAGLSALAVALVVYLEANTEHDYRAAGSFLMVSPDVSTADDDPNAALPPLMQQFLDSDLAQQLESDGAQVTASPRQDGSYEVFAFAATQDAAREALELAVEWTLDRFETTQVEAGVASTDRIELVVGADPAVWALGDGSGAAATSVQVDTAAANPNPYGAAQALRLLQIVATSDAGRARFSQQASDTASFEFAADPRGSPPLVNVSATDRDAQAGMDAFGAIVALLEEELDDRQARAGVSPTERHRLEPIALPIEASRMDSVPSPRSWLILVAGVVAALGIGALADRFLLRRDARP